MEIPYLCPYKISLLLPLILILHCGHSLCRCLDFTCIIFILGYTMQEPKCTLLIYRAEIFFTLIRLYLVIWCRYQGWGSSAAHTAPKRHHTGGPGRRRGRSSPRRRRRSACFGDIWLNKPEFFVCRLAKNVTVFLCFFGGEKRGKEVYSLIVYKINILSLFS